MAEKRYIEVTEAAQYADVFFADPLLKIAAASFLATAPTADVAEVVHGRWLTLEEYSTIIGADVEDDPCSGWIYCSECGKPSRSFNNWNYCPECGAKMDGERKTKKNP